MTVWIAAVLGLTAVTVFFVIAMVMNEQRHRVLRHEAIIDPATVELPDPAAATPWNPKLRAQQWPNPLAEPPVLTAEAAGLYSEAAARRAVNFRHIGEGMIAAFGWLFALTATGFIQSWPAPPFGGTLFLFIGAIAGIGIGIGIKGAMADRWDRITHAYEVATRKIGAESPAVPVTRVEGTRSVSARFAAAWRAFRS
ncbi:hypothetical protein AB0B28_06690 [Glycomyces sp. NPDC046736]|uniref:hypothetical protein n=1 Tax=Glycomyces sp. NPDC046736 TaxID=3155615 RepID=UPI0033E33749